jgi:predicted RNA-binding Zn ribbon-like protein
VYCHFVASSSSAEPRFVWVGERLCLDFVNTEIVDAGDRVDLLETFGDLVRWCAAAHVLTPTEARTVARQWDGRAAGHDALREAVRFRAALREMVERFADGRTHARQETLDAINEGMALGGGGREVVRTADGYRVRARRSFHAPRQFLVPIAESAADLLSTDDLSLVKRCQNPQCVLFFYDTTKNHARRWCSMAACGNRAKVAAHYRRRARGE